MIVTKFTICANCVSKNQEGTLSRKIPDLQLLPEIKPQQHSCRICGSAEQLALISAAAPERQLIRSSNQRFLQQIKADLGVSSKQKAKTSTDRCPTCGKRIKP